MLFIRDSSNSQGRETRKLKDEKRQANLPKIKLCSYINERENTLELKKITRERDNMISESIIM